MVNSTVMQNIQDAIMNRQEFLGGRGVEKTNLGEGGFILTKPQLVLVNS